MSKRLLATAIVATACAAALIAQAQAPAPPALAASPGACLTAARAYRQALMKDLQARLKESGRPVAAEDVAGVNARAAEYASACAAPFAKTEVAAADVPALAELQVEAQQLDAAKQTLARALAAPGADAAVKAATLTTGVRILARQIRQPGVLDQAEAWVAELEKLPASFVRERIEAHGVLNGYYRADDIDAGIIRHSTRLLELNAGMSADQRIPALANTIIAAYSNLAEAWAGQEQTAKALDLLRRAPVELAGVEGVAERLAPTVERYELVGKPAPALQAPAWLNAPEGTSTLEMPGGVTWLQFTAHWCGPCREAYPAAVRLQQQFGGKGFRVVMATQLYGYFENRRNLAPADEMAAIREYFPKHGIIWPVAVSDNLPPVTENGRMVRQLNVNDARYKVAGIPQIHIIDRKGVIRLIMIGFDEANEPRLSAMIQRLLTQ
jgi:thiol-disulfide isomerase/thioredoxin